MIEATIKDILSGWQKRKYKGLIGCRVSLIEMNPRRYIKNAFGVHIAGVVRARKNSRIQRGKYEGLFLSAVELEDVVVDDYGED